MRMSDSCCGCGASGLKKWDRRTLNNKLVLQVFTSFLEEIGKSIDVFSGRDALMVCRKCFSSYERYENLRKTIKNNLMYAMSVAVPVAVPESIASAAKRPRIEASTSSSPDVAVHVNYQKPKTYVLTPHRKRLGKAVARSSHKAVAIECMKNQISCNHALSIMCRLIHKEIRSIASTKFESALLYKSKDSIYEFEWERVCLEIATHAPVLLKVLTAATKTRTQRPNQSAVIGTCFAVILKHRNPNLNLLQRVISLILYSGHCSKQVYQRLQPLNLTMSYSSLLRLLDKVGENHDARVKSWNKAIVEQMKNSKGTTSSTLTTYHDLTSGPEKEVAVSDESDSDSDTSWRSVSLISSDEEYWTEDENESSDELSAEEDASEVRTSHSQPSGEDSSTNLQPSTITLYRLCGDNIDKTVRQRYMRSDSRGGSSLHYFHSYAAADRIDFSHLSEERLPASLDSDTKASLILPSLEDEETLQQNVKILISRVLYDHLPYFKATFDGIVTWHIKHRFYDEMSSKSDTVPLGILPKNENKGDEMVEIVTHLHQYVPAIEFEEEMVIPSSGEAVKVPKARFSPVLLGGDQLTAARVRGAKKAKVSADVPSTRLEGIIPVAEDWHTKMNFLGVLWKHYYSTDSAAEHGTLFQLRNRLGRSNVVTDPTKNFNACEDFFLVAVSGYIIAAAMKALKMTSMSAKPAAFTAIGAKPEDVWMLDNERRKEVLDKVCCEVVKCAEFSFIQEVSPGKDGVSSYSKKLLGLGCFYLEYRDAIKEGDGTRVLRCWRYLLPIFFGTGRTNYSCEVLNMLHQELTLPPRLAAQLLWSRFVNTHGVPGRNIAADLYMEHLNRVAKDAIKGLGANKTERAIGRVGKAIGTIAPLLQKFDTVNNIREVSGAHKRANVNKDTEVIVTELTNNEVFSNVAGRKHPSFSSPKDLLHARPANDLQEWMVQRLKKIVHT